MKSLPNKSQVRRAITIVQSKINFLKSQINDLQISPSHHQIGKSNIGKINAALLNLRALEQNINDIILFTLEQLKEDDSRD